MRLYDFFGVLVWFCVLVVCVGLVGCRLSEGGGDSVDELRLLGVKSAEGGGQKREDGGQTAGVFEEAAAVRAREVLADFPLESVLYVDVAESGDRRQVTGDRNQVTGGRQQETDKLSGYLNQAFASFQGMGDGGERLGSGSDSGSSAGFSASSVLSPVSSQVSLGMDQAWSQAMGVMPQGMGGDLPYQDQRFVAAFYGAMQGLAGQKVGQAKGAVQQAVLRSTGLSGDRGAGGVDPEMFAHLSEEGKLALTQAMVNAALDAGSESVSSFMAQLETSFTASAEGDPTYSVLGIVPVWESSDLAHTTFVQSTILSQDQRTTLNIGGAYRYLSEDQQHLYGINAFYDQEFRYDHRRMSLGADYQNSLLGFQANRYVALSDWRSGAKTGFEERALSGYDAQISGKLPWVAGLEAFYKRLIWQRKTGDDIQGEQIGLEYTPVPAITLRAGHEKDDERGSGFMAGVQVNTTLGGQEGLDPLAWTESEDFLNVAQQRYQKVRRENTIRTEEREKTSVSGVSVRTQQITAVVGAPTFGQMGMAPVSPISMGTVIPNDSDVLSEAGEGFTLRFSDGAVMMVGSDVRVRIQETRMTYLSGTGSIQYVSGTGTPHVLSVPGGEVQLLGTDISVVPQSALASTIMVHDGRIVATARDASNALVPSETETGMLGDVVLLETLSATMGEASKLPPADISNPVDPVLKHQTQLFDDRIRDPQQINSITQNPKAVPFVTHIPVYTGTAVPALGQSFEMTVTFNKPVNVSGSPSLRLAITANPSGETRYASYVGGSGTNTLTFRWDPVDVTGISAIEVTQIDQSSGSITSVEGGQTAESFVPKQTLSMPAYTIDVSPSVIDYNNQNQVTLSVTNHGAGNSAVIALNGTALPPIPAAASVPLNVTALPDGPITVTYYEIENTKTLLSVSANAVKDISDTLPPTVTLNPVTSPSANPAQTFTGTVSDNIGVPSVQVRISPNNIIHTATVTGNTWSASVSGLTDDTYTVLARATDGAGNSTDTPEQTLILNSAAPTATLSSIAGIPYTGATVLTHDATPTLTGTATGGGSATVSQVEISLDNGTTWVNATGTTSWSYTPSANLADIIYSVQIRVTNSLSTQATTPFTSALRIDTTAPAAPSAPDLISADDTGSSSTDNITRQTNVTLNGTAEVGSTVALYDNGTCTGTALGTTTATGGNYSFSVPLPTDGAYTFTAKATDAGNNASPCSTALSLTRDTTAPTVSMAISSPSAGTYTSGQVITATATFSEAVSGTATLPFRVNGVATAAQTCTGTGSTRTCAYTLTSTDNGAITLAADTLSGTLSDTAGNTATPTHSAVNPNITADTSAFTVTSVAIQSGGSGSYLTSTSPTLRYTFSEAVNASSITASDFTPSSGTVTSVTPVGSTPVTQYDVALSGLSQGSLTLTIAAGSITSQSASKPIAANSNGAYTVDSVGPTVAFTGSSSVIAADSTTLTGTASDASGIVSVTASSGTGPACSMSGTTSWSCGLSGITSGTYTYTATATDAAGNTTTSTGFTLTRSTSAPTLSLSSSTPTLPTAGGFTNATTLSLSFTAAPTGGATSITSVEVSTDGITYSVPTTFGSGTWNTASLTLTNGSTYTLKARATDNLGNQTEISVDTFTVDAAGPTITTLTAPANGTYASGQNLDFVATMSEATTVTGTPRLALTIGSTTQYATYLSGSGTTSLTFRYTTQSSDNDTDGITVTSPLELNSGTLTDTAGNTATLTFTPPSTTGVLVDTAGPTITGIAFSNTGCTSNVCGPTDVVNVDVTFSENVTPSTTPPLAATLPVTIGATTTYTAAYASQPSANTLRFTKTIAATGSGETGALSTPASPTLTLTAGTLRDSAGNSATLTSTIAAGNSGYTVDTTAPTGTVTTLSTNDTTPALSGTISEASTPAPTATVTVNSQGPYPVTIAGTAPNYTWTLADNTITPALALGIYNVTLTITDAAGNLGNDTTTNELTIVAGGLTLQDTVSAGLGPVFIAISPDGKSAYVSNQNGNSMSRYKRDTGTGSLTFQESITGLSTPRDIVISPDGKSVYIVNNGSSSISMYSRNTDNGELHGTLTPLTTSTISTGSGSGPIGMTISPDGTSVYVAGGVSNQVIMFNRNSNNGILTYLNNGVLADSIVATNGMPRFITISPDGLSVYVSLFTLSNNILGFNRNTNNGTLSQQQTVTAGVNPRYITIFGDGGSVYITNQGTGDQGNTISMYSRAPNGVLSLPRTIASGAAPAGVVVSPDGGRVYAANVLSNSVSMYSRDTANGNLNPLTPSTIPTGTAPFGVALYGNWLYVTNRSSGTISIYQQQ